MTTSERVKQAIYDQGNGQYGEFTHIVNSTADIREDMTFVDLWFDRVDFEEFALRLENEFEIEVPFAEYTEWDTVGDVVKWVEENGG